MKKILSIVLAVLMLVSCANMAFAATITQETAEPKAADVVVQTTLDDSEMPATGTYEITIPANTNIVWGSQNSTAVMDYTVKSQLALGAKLTVEVVASSDALVCTADTTKTLAYTSTGLDEVKEYGEINNGVVAPVTITVPDWSNVPVADYATTLTYTVTYVAPTTTP